MQLDLKLHPWRVYIGMQFSAAHTNLPLAVTTAIQRGGRIIGPKGEVMTEDDVRKAWAAR